MKLGEDKTSIGNPERVESLINRVYSTPLGLNRYYFSPPPVSQKVIHISSPSGLRNDIDNRFVCWFNCSLGEINAYIFFRAELIK